MEKIVCVVNKSKKKYNFKIFKYNIPYYTENVPCNF